MNWSFNIFFLKSEFVTPHENPVFEKQGHNKKTKLSQILIRINFYQNISMTDVFFCYLYLIMNRLENS